MNHVLFLFSGLPSADPIDEELAPERLRLEKELAFAVAQYNHVQPKESFIVWFLKRNEKDGLNFTFTHMGNNHIDIQWWDESKRVGYIDRIKA